MIVTPEPARVFRPGLPADAQSIRSLLRQTNLSAPSIGKLERVPHSRIGEVLTFVCDQNRNWSVFFNGAILEKKRKSSTLRCIPIIAVRGTQLFF